MSVFLFLPFSWWLDYFTWTETGSRFNYCFMPWIKLVRGLTLRSLTCCLYCLWYVRMQAFKFYLQTVAGSLSVALNYYTCPTVWIISSHWAACRCLCRAFSAADR